MKLRIAAAVAAAIIVLSPVAAVAAPSSMLPQGPNSYKLPWYAQWVPFVIWPASGSTPKGGTGLEYQVIYVPSKNEVQLLVVNDTDKEIQVKAPTALITDFALWQGARLVWRASAGKTYAQTETGLSLRPGEGKLYKESLPYVAPGTYLLQGYFIPETKWAPVASAYVTVQVPAYDPLQYSVEYLSPSWFNGSPRLRVTIKNASDKDIALPYQYGYQVLVKKPGSQDYLGNVGIGQSLGTIAAGATRYVFVDLSPLGPGTYQALVRSNLAAGWYRTVAQTYFTIR